MARSGRGADVLLVDGTIAGIRTLEPDDAAALAALHERATAESLRLRFFSASPRAAQEYVEHVCRSHQTVALGATQREQVVGLATAEPLDPATAEVSSLVDDSVQGRGLGTLLLEHLAAAARRRGITQFVAEVLAENHAMIRVFVDAGFSVSGHLDGAVVEVLMDAAASQRAVTAADVRDGLAEARSLHPCSTRALLP